MRRSLCELVVAGALDLDSLPADDEEAIAELTRIKGIGRWSAEIYLLFAEGRPDIWPAGDLAVQAAWQAAGLEARTPERKARPANWRKPGGRIAAPRRSSPGIATTTRRSVRGGDHGYTQGNLHRHSGGGSTSLGIGRAIARHFGARGWFVGLGDIDERRHGAQPRRCCPTGQELTRTGSTCATRNCGRARSPISRGRRAGGSTWCATTPAWHWADAWSDLSEAEIDQLASTST
jgi:hypothetical protein